MEKGVVVEGMVVLGIDVFGRFGGRVLKAMESFWGRVGIYIF